MAMFKHLFESNTVYCQPNLVSFMGLQISTPTIIFYRTSLTRSFPAQFVVEGDSKISYVLFVECLMVITLTILYGVLVV